MSHRVAVPKAFVLPFLPVFMLISLIVVSQASGRGRRSLASESAVVRRSDPSAVVAFPAFSFSFDTVASPQFAGVPFTITIRALDMFGDPATSFTETVTLWDNTESLLPTAVDFHSGVFTGPVTVTVSVQNDVIHAEHMLIYGESNPFHVLDANRVYLPLIYRNHPLPWELGAGSQGRTVYQVAVCPWDQEVLMPAPTGRGCSRASTAALPGVPPA